MPRKRKKDMEDEKTPDMYHAIVKFRKNSKGKKTVRIHIRYFKRKCQKKVDFPFPKEIKEGDLLPWKYYEGEQIIVYHRRGNIHNHGRNRYDYVDRENSIVPKNLTHRLEILVLKAHAENSE